MTPTLTIEPLTRIAFAPFGDVVEADPSTMRLINSGTTERFHGLATADALGDGARIILNIFRGNPRRFPYKVDMMERHPLGSQSFQPLDNRPWLVIVAENENGEPGRPRVFLASGRQGVNYRPDVWHHPLMALDQPSDFLIVDRDGPGVNLHEHVYYTPYIIEEFNP